VYCSGYLLHEPVVTLALTRLISVFQQRVKICSKAMQQLHKTKAHKSAPLIALLLPIKRYRGTHPSWRQSIICMNAHIDCILHPRGESRGNGCKRVRVCVVFASMCERGEERPGQCVYSLRARTSVYACIHLHVHVNLHLFVIVCH
jgi:hypothetical protein